MIKGIMDIAQTVDWDRCKLPVVDTGMRSLGGCPCNDKPYSIPLCLAGNEQARNGQSEIYCKVVQKRVQRTQMHRGSNAINGTQDIDLSSLALMKPHGLDGVFN